MSLIKIGENAEGTVAIFKLDVSQEDLIGKGIAIKAEYNSTAGPTLVQTSEVVVGTTDFEVPILVDGYYHVEAALISTIPLGIDTFYFNESLNKVIKIDGSNIENDSSSSDYLKTIVPNVIDIFSLNNSIALKGKLTSDLVRLYMQTSTDRGHNSEVINAEKLLNQVGTLTHGSYYQWCQGNYIEAQRIVEHIETYKTQSDD